MTSVQLQPGKKIYFASDFHLGIPDYPSSREREERICRWLRQIKPDCQQLYLVGDLFDAWIEYDRAVPKGYIRFLGQLAELADEGVQLIIFTGNHDLWMKGYFEEELGATVYREIQNITLGNNRFHIGHGDGVSKQEHNYIRMKKLFQHPLAQWLYRKLHPDWGIGIADYFSRRGIKHRTMEDKNMKSDEEEHQIQYALQLDQQKVSDFIVFGHRHIPCQRILPFQTTFINLGDWLQFNTYGVYDGERFDLVTFPS